MADSIKEVKKAKKLYLFIGTLLFVFTCRYGDGSVG
jgi:hypothetical protein